MKVTPDTKIAALLKAHDQALDAIVSITPKFEKLRNPLLRKLMAGRTSIAMAAKISGCGVQAFYDKLKPLGFEVDEAAAIAPVQQHEVPAFLHRVKEKDIRTLDVRPIIDNGRDPLKEIMKTIKSAPLDGAVKIINSFEPTPLISLLENQGYQYFIDNVEEDVVETWFFREADAGKELDLGVDVQTEGFDEVLEKFRNNLKEIDVRHLPMPQPMHTILSELETLPQEKALFVNHKRIPVFLLPELKDRAFDYRIKEISDGEVKLLIFK